MSSHLAKESHLAKLARATIPTPRWLKTDFSNPDRQLAVLSFEAGENMREVFEQLSAEDQEDLVFQAGSILAKIHKLHFEQSLSKPPSAMDYLLESLALPRVQSRLSACTPQELEHFIKTNAHLLKNEHECLVHGDYNRQNILVQRHHNSKWEISYILDWEFACMGNPLMDVASFLGMPPYSDYAQIFAHGYRSAGGTLPLDWLQRSKMLDLLSMLDFLQFEHDAPALFARVNHTISMLIRRHFTDSANF